MEGRDGITDRNHGVGGGEPPKRLGASDRRREKWLQDTDTGLRATASEDVGPPTERSKAAPSTDEIAEGRVVDRLTIGKLEKMREMEELNDLRQAHVGGTTNIRPEVIASIAGAAAASVPGVISLGTPSIRRVVRERLGGAERKARGVEVEAGRKEAILDINLRVVYGYSIPQIVVQVRTSVADGLLKLCGMESKKINIRVTSIEFPDRMSGRVE